MPATKFLEDSRVHEKCDYQNLKVMWKTYSVGYLRRAKLDIPRKALKVVFNKSFGEDAETSAFWLFEIPAFAENPTEAGLEVHNLSPKHSCGEVMIKLRLHLEQQPHTIQVLLRNMTVFSCRHVGRKQGEVSFYRTPFQQQCPATFTTVVDSIACKPNTLTSSADGSLKLPGSPESQEMKDQSGLQCVCKLGVTVE